MQFGAVQQYGSTSKRSISIALNQGGLGRPSLLSILNEVSGSYDGVLGRYRPDLRSIHVPSDARQ